jgi:hypothetical protein
MAFVRQNSDAGHRENDRPGLWREILKSPHHGVDVALQRFGEQRMEARRDRAFEMPGRLDHRIAARGALDDAAVDLGAVGLEDHAEAGPADAIEARLLQRHGDAFGFRGQAEQAQLRARPFGDKDRCAAWIGERHRARDLAVQQRRPPDLRRESDVGGAHVERRPVVAEGGGCVGAAADEAEGKAPDALRAAVIDAAERRLAPDPGRQRAVGDRSRVIPQPAPADGEDNNQRDRRQHRPQPAAARHRRTPAHRPRRRTHHAQRRIAGHCRHYSPVRRRHCAAIVILLGEPKSGRQRGLRGRCAPAPSTRPGTCGCSAMAR